MPMSLPGLIGATPRKKPARATLRGESPSKALGCDRIGRVVERAFELAHLTKDQASREMGYADASTVSKWIAGEVPVQVSRLWSVPQLRAAFIVALAEDAGDGAVTVERTLRVSRLA